MSVFTYSSILVSLAVGLWKLSSVARCWMKFAVFLILCICSCLLIPIWCFRPRDTRNPLIPCMWFRAACRFWGLKYTVEGHQNVVKNSGAVVLINHQSIIDLIALAHLWPIIPNGTVISKREILYTPPFGLAFWLVGTIFIDRSDSKSAISTVNSTSTIIRERQSHILMFPEGTRNNGTKLKPFRKGAFHLAVESQTPIQPVAISRYSFLGSHRFESGEVKIRILPPISTEGCTAKDVPRLVDEAYKVMSENVDLLTKSLNSKL